MARPYSQDLRDRVIEATGNGTSARQAAVRFDVGVSTAIKWVERLRDSGERSARRQGRRPSSKLDAHRDFLLAVIEAAPDATIKELQRRLVEEKGVRASTGTIWTFLDRCGLMQFQRTCWWSSSRCSHLKCWCTRSMSSTAVNVRSGSTIARLPCSHRGSIGLSQGLFTGKRHTRIRTPPVRFTVRLCVLIHPCTAWLTGQVALSHTSTHTRLPSFANL